jgi:hypothetical protein
MILVMQFISVAPSPEINKSPALGLGWMFLEGSTSLGRNTSLGLVFFPGDVPMRLFDAEGAENWVQTHRKWEQDSQQCASSVVEKWLQ